MKTYRFFARLGQTLCALSLLAVVAMAAAPVVKTVPWVASNPLIPHSTYAAKVITLKGTCDQQAANLRWTWDFGDGSPVATGTVTNRYVIEATHLYSGAVNTIFTARLTVQNTTTGEIGTRTYYVQMLNKALEVEVNVAIDEGLWYLHKTQYRFNDGTFDLGDWTTTYVYYGVSVANLNAFEVNGHLETGDAANPYTETVQRSMRRLFQWLTTRSIGLQSLGNPDANANGYGVKVNQGYEFYQGGMFMDAIVASGTPNAVATTGPAPVGTNPGIRGRTYKAIVQDMVDDHSWAQYDNILYGGWRYSAQDYPDNSACQWAAIGLVAAERVWGCVIPQWVKRSNINWLAYSQTPATGGGYAGAFGYTDPNYFPWGPYASSPSGMVQLVLDGIGRGQTGPTGAPSWNLAETFMRNNFGNTGGAYYAVKEYYYGLFSFVKSMLLHQPAPIVMLHSQTAGVADIDWYGAETSKGAQTDGVARTLVDDQTTSGSTSGRWWGHNMSVDQYHFETAWAIMMLHKTVFESGVPVAVVKAVPNPSVVGQMVTLDGSDSYHQDSVKSIVRWDWDLNADGVFGDASGPLATTNFAAVGNYPVKLRVTDDGTPSKTAESTLAVRVTNPPVAPTADADGPYVFCAESKPWFLDGRKSVNPDEGGSEPHIPAYPGDTIKLYAWDLNGDGQFDDAVGPTPNVTSFFEAQGGGSHLVQLRVTDSTATAYPSSGYPDLVSTTSAYVTVVALGECPCVELTGSPTDKEIVLTWTQYTGADHYNVYRSIVSGGPYTLVGSVSASAGTAFVDHPGILNQVYYYVVRPAAANGDEVCQSNQVFAEPLHPIPTVACTPTIMSNLAKYYYTLTCASVCFGRNQLEIYIGDTASAQIAGPFSTDNAVYIRTGLATPAIRAGNATVRGYVMTKGSARVWAVDPIGQKSLEVIIP